jgi:phosphatidylglycerophosphate synthase
MLFFIGAVFVVLAVIALFVGAWWGVPILLVAALIAGFYVAAARKRDPSVGTIERGKRAEPTGAPRKATGGTGETANERVGQG